MGSVCAEEHRLHHPFSPKKKGGLEIPPRKLLSHRAAADVFMDSPQEFEQSLPYNTGGGSESDDSDSDPYSSNHFRMYEFKVRRCTRSRSHDWTDCPFAHPSEKARRRDPRRFHYSGTVCSEYRHGSCSRGDNCEFAHGVFESWLHPSRYRTEACRDGKSCKRKVCFFAHSQRELRILPLQADDSPVEPTDNHRISTSSAMHQLTGVGHCCMYCHQPSAVISSPTSTLMDLSHLSSPPVSPSHSLSPPLSPVKYCSSLGSRGLFPASHYADRLADSGRYRDALGEIIHSLDAMKVADVSSRDPRNKRNFPRVDAAFPTGDDQTQFLLSLAAPSPASMSARDPSRNFKVDYDNAGDGLAAASNPDLGWVNELLT